MKQVAKGWVKLHNNKCHKFELLFTKYHHHDQNSDEMGRPCNTQGKCDKYKTQNTGHKPRSKSMAEK
jgi:hypothetical protein